jgi:hypothetical protein
MGYCLTHDDLEDIALSLSSTTTKDWLIVACYSYLIIIFVSYVL